MEHPHPKKRGWKRVDKVVCRDTEWSNFFKETVGTTRLGVDAGLQNTWTRRSICLGSIGSISSGGLVLFLVERFRHALLLAYPSK